MNVSAICAYCIGLLGITGCLTWLSLLTICRVPTAAFLWQCHRNQYKCNNNLKNNNNDNNNNNTVVSPLAASYVDRAATDAGTVADMTATRKTEKYSTLSSAYRFEPIAVENLGVFSSTTLNFISELGRRICVHTRDARETSYLFQRISIMRHRFNSVLLHDILPVDLPDLWPSDSFCSF